MDKNILSSKRLLIDKANASMVLVLAVTSVVTVFCLVASRALLSQHGYQSRVISHKQAALKQLQTNNKVAVQLVDAYKAFVDPAENIIGGRSAGTGDKDGDNAKIILDALPSKYDFPALAASLEKILSHRGATINTISGTDDEIKQTDALSASPVEMPFQVSLASSFGGAQSIIDVLQRSIRPIQISKIDLTGTDKSLIVNISATTYYQPEKTLSIDKKVIQ